MILKSSTARARLDSPSNLINRLSIPTSPKVTVIPKARIGGAVGSALPKFVRTQVAILTRSGIKGTEVADSIGISSQEANNIKRGDIKGIDEAAVDRALGKVRDAALDRLMGSMGMMTDEKLGKCKAGELSTIAANMARVVEKTLPRDQSGTPVANVIIYAPQIRQESSFKTVDV